MVRGVILWVLDVLELCNMLADVVANVDLLLVELIAVLMLWTTIVVTNVTSLGAKILCGNLLIWFIGVIELLCMWCYDTET